MDEFLTDFVELLDRHCVTISHSGKIAIHVLSGEEIVFEGSTINWWDVIEERNKLRKN